MECKDQADSVLQPDFRPPNPRIVGFSLQNNHNIRDTFMDSGNQKSSKPFNLFPKIERAPFLVPGEYPIYALHHYLKYTNRIDTFRTWPQSHLISPAGFLFTGEGVPSVG